MYRSKRAFIVTLVAIFGLIAGACSDDGSTSTASSSSGSEASGSSDASSSSYPTAKISVVAVKASTPGLPTWVAKEQGFFDEQGLDVELVNLTSGQAIVSALTSGSVQMTPQTISTAVQLKQQGVNSRVVAGAFHAIPYILVAPADTSVPVATASNWEDTITALKGKSIAAGGPGSSFDFIMRSIFVSAGLNDTDFANIQVQAGAPQIAAVEQGQVDAVLADIGTAKAAVAAGGKVVMDLTTEGPPETVDQVWSGFMTTDEDIAKIPDLDKRLFAAMKKTADWMKDAANLAEFHRIAVEVSGVPESASLDDTLEIQAEIFQPVLPAAGVQSTIDFLTKTGQVSASPVVKPADIFYREALN